MVPCLNNDLLHYDAMFLHGMRDICYEIYREMLSCVPAFVILVFLSFTSILLDFILTTHARNTCTWFLLFLPFSVSSLLVCRIMLRSNR